MKRRSFGPAIERLDPDADVFGRGLRIFDEDIEVPIVIKHSGVEQFVFQATSRAPSILLNQIPIRKLALRILVEVLHVAVRRSVVEIEVIFFDVLAVIAFDGTRPNARSFRIGSRPFQNARANTIIW